MIAALFLLASQRPLLNVPAPCKSDSDNHRAGTLENIHVVQSEKSNRLTVRPARGWYCTAHPPGPTRPCATSWCVAKSGTVRL